MQNKTLDYRWGLEERKESQICAKYFRILVWSCAKYFVYHTSTPSFQSMGVLLTFWDELQPFVLENDLKPNTDNLKASHKIEV